MRPAFSALLLFALTSSIAALAGNAPPPPPPNEPNCQAVYQACVNGKYVYGDAKEGNGLYRDCIGPLVNGTQPPKAAPAGVTYPGADIQAKAAICHKHHPRWGGH